ncbi:MAG: hypothetical protein HYU64_12550 [Armatimonadetes bacterium]|nr:hypothetical protein [Armatimonadota bacterium]
MDEIKLSTPEQIELSYELAGLGSRFLAIFLDTLIQLGAVLCFGLIAIPVGLISRNFGPASWMEILAISISAIFPFFALNICDITNLCAKSL